MTIPEPTWWVPTATGANRLAHLLPTGPRTNPHAVTIAACGEQRRSWAPHDPDSGVEQCSECARAASGARPAPLEPRRDDWWASASITTRVVRAHLMPYGYAGGRAEALCGRGYLRWAPVSADSPMWRCPACEVIGGSSSRRTPTRQEARRIGLVAAAWCLEQDRPGELGELLSMLLEHPDAARRAS